MPARRPWMRRRVPVPFLLGSAFAPAAAVGVLLLVFLPRGVPEVADSGAIAVGTPLRLVGTRAGGQASLPVASIADGRILLFLKLAGPPDPAQRYDLILRGSSGKEFGQVVSGAAFDRTGALGVMIDPDLFTDGEAVEVRVAPEGNPSASSLFFDRFILQHSPSTDR